MSKYQWLKDALDSYGWLELCFFTDEEAILDELQRLDEDVNWRTVFDRFTSADFQGDYTVLFTLSSSLIVPVGYIAKQLTQAFWNLYQQPVIIGVMRERLAFSDTQHPNQVFDGEAE